MQRRLCTVYRSSRVAEMYLYVDRAQGLAPVPEPLLQRFGEPQQVLVLLLEPTRRLARAEAAAVLECIDRQGFYLQMPPAEGSDDERRD